MNDESTQRLQVKRLLETDSLRTSTAQLSEGLEAAEPFLLVTGGAGTGKTLLVRAAVAAWGSKAVVSVITNPTLTRIELLEEIVRRFGIEPPENPTKPQLLACLDRRISEVSKAAQVAVVVIDDAHDLPPDLLGELRLLVNTTDPAARLKILLAGLPELERRLDEPAFAALKQRVAFHCRVEPLSSHESRRYIQEVVCPALGLDPGFLPRKACGEVFRRSGGVPRVIDTLAARAVAAARSARSRTVSPEDVESAAAALGIQVPAVVDPAPVSNLRAVPEPARATETSTAPEPVRASETSTAPPARATERTTSPGRTRAAETAIALEPASAIARLPDPIVTTVKNDRPQSGDSLTQDWVSRFIRPDEPRFGELIGAATREPDLVAGTDLESEEVGQETERPASQAPKARAAGIRSARQPARKRRGIWDRRYAQPGVRRGFSPVVTGLIALVIVSLATILVLSLLSRNDPPAGDVRVASRPHDAPIPTRAAAPAPETQPSRPVAIPPAPKLSAPPETPKPRARAEAPTESAAPRSNERFSLDVGSYMSEERATSERDYLAQEAGLEGWVIPEASEGVTMYRVVLGVFSSTERAQGAADVLFTRDLVYQARVIPLPPRRLRQ